MKKSWRRMKTTTQKRRETNFLWEECMIHTSHVMIVLLKRWEGVRDMLREVKVKLLKLKVLEVD